MLFLAFILKSPAISFLSEARQLSLQVFDFEVQTGDRVCLLVSLLFERELDELDFTNFGSDRIIFLSQRRQVLTKRLQSFTVDRVQVVHFS